ncbi:MAG: extracellular solute-binding protein [Clostridia bacterium]|nr:extracellular solute-binding protein [Clostridia bacterium]
MKFKSIVAVLMVAAMVLLLCACGAKKQETSYDIKVWVAENAVELTKSQIAKFNETNTDGLKFNATIEPVSEADAGTNMVTDVEAGGDIYCFAQDQFARLVQANALAKLGVAAAKTVSEANDAGVVAAAKSGEDLFAYPLTADNGYFMYYDKSVIPDADVDSLEKLIEDCEKAGKYFAFETNTGAWYTASWFFATGCVSDWTTDSDGNFLSVHDTFNSPEGLIAVKGMKKLVDSKMHLSSSKGSEFASGAAIVVSGTWDFEAVKGYLGDNMGVADLPSFEVDGKTYHLGSFNGCKLMGVKPQTDAAKQAAVHKLAQYLTSEECQMERFNTLSWGPANSNAQKSEAVQANPGLAALLSQSPYSVPQGQIHGSWWDIAKVIADDVKAATDDAGLQAALDNYKNKIDALFSMSEDEKNAFTVIGSIGGDTWSVDIAMTEVSTGVWETAPIELKAGEEFKVRQGKSWNVAYPSDNFKVEADGTFVIHLEASTGEVTLVTK